MGKIETVVYYIAVVLLMTTLAALSQSGHRNLSRNCSVRFKWFFLFLSFFVGWFTISFTKIGADYENYSWIITFSKDFMSRSFVEIGFNSLCYLLFSISNNVDIVIFFLKSISIALFFLSFGILRKKIIIWPGVLFYGLFLFLRFYLLSMILASALVFFSMAVMLRGRPILAFVILLLSCTVHSSCILIIPTYLLFIVFSGNKKRFSNLKIMSTVIIYALVVLGAPLLYDLLIPNIEALRQYAAYGSANNNGFGFMLLVKYVPLCLVCYNILKKSQNNLNANLVIVFLVSSIAFDVLSYRYDVVSRISYLFIGVQCLLVPAHLWGVKHEFDGTIIKSKDYLGFWLMYVAVFGFYTFFSIVNSSTSAVENYTFYNPFG